MVNRGGESLCEIDARFPACRRAFKVDGKNLLGDGAKLYGEIEYKWTVASHCKIGLFEFFKSESNLKLSRETDNVFINIL